MHTLRTRVMPAVALACTLAGAPAAAQPVKTANGTVEGTKSENGILVYRGIPFARPADRRPAMEAAAARCELDGRQESGQLRGQLHAAAGVRRHVIPRQRHERGLPLPERVDAEGRRGSGAAGARVLLRRRLHRRRRLGAALRRRGHGPQGHRRPDGQLPPQRVRLSGASRAERGVAETRLRQLRPARSGRGARVGAEEHCRLRRRSAAGHDRRRVGRLDFGQRADGVAAVEGTDRRRDRRERRR